MRLHRPSALATPRLASLFIAALALVATACSVDVAVLDDPEPASSASADGEAGKIATTTNVSTDCDNGLTADGADLLATRSSTDPLPVYELDVVVDPAVGSVEGSVVATIPADDDALKFRIFPGLEAFEANFSIDMLTLDGESVDYTVDQALLSIDNPAGADATVTVDIDFSYAVNQMAANTNIFGALSGDTLQPDQVGLLGRTESGMQMGHWFPVWLPDGTRTDPDPAGFGDIGAFPASVICARVLAPAEYTVITGGSRFDTEDDGTIVEGAAGLRDFAMLLSSDIDMLKGEVDGVEVRVWGPAGDQESLQTVLDYSLASQQALVDAFGDYPWTEVDVVSAPLGGGVGGMEWPGMVWIERGMFAGGIAGLGHMGDLGEMFGGSDLFGDEDPFGDMFDELLGEMGGDALDTALEWTIAHELGHEWFHALVGNDSIASPAVDEPLAQFAACLAMERIHPDRWLEICRAQTTDQFAQAQALGIADAAADQASDEFDSAMQYSTVVYGKAPGFYFEAAELMGWDGLTEALRSFVQEHAFTLVGTDVLREHLVEAAGDDGPTIDALWDRWFSQAVGAEDIEPASPFGGLGSGDLGAGGLDDMGDLGELFGPDSPFGEGLLGPDGELDLEGLMGEGSIFELLEDGEITDEELQQWLEDQLGGN